MRNSLPIIIPVILAAAIASGAPAQNAKAEKNMSPQSTSHHQRQNQPAQRPRQCAAHRHAGRTDRQTTTKQTKTHERSIPLCEVRTINEKTARRRFLRDRVQAPASQGRED